MFTPPFILSIAGGGSTYTPGIVKSLMVRLQDFPLAEIRLYDIDEARQNTIAPVVEKVIRDHSQSIKFTVTSDPEVAFSGAHFVFAQMRVGQYKMREQDEKIPLRHGVVGQETCGPGGLAYGLRTILPMVELIDLVDRYAHEKAWIVNYSNPAAIVAEGVRRLRPNARVLNICDMPVAIERNMAEILECDRHDLEVDYFGLNHIGWFTKVRLNGEAARLAPGARIRDENNLLAMSAALTGRRLTVNYTVEALFDGSVLLRDVWILRADEIANFWPRSREEAARYQLDPAAQVWSRRSA